MKPGIHPDYHTIKVVMTDGTSYETRSTYGKEGDTLTLDVDPLTHPAWTGGTTIRQTGRVERFSKQFGGMDFSKGNAAGGNAAESADADKKKKSDKK